MKVQYPEVRLRLLSTLDQTDELEWLVVAGAFLRSWWLAEEAVRGNEPLDEMATWARWDDQTEKQVRDLRFEAEALVRRELRKRRVSALAAEWKATFNPVAALIGSLAWVVAKMGAGIVGAIGVILFGWLVLTISPTAQDLARATVDRLLPAGAHPQSSPEKSAE